MAEGLIQNCFRLLFFMAQAEQTALQVASYARTLGDFACDSLVEHYPG